MQQFLVIVPWNQSVAISTRIYNEINPDRQPIWYTQLSTDKALITCFDENEKEHAREFFWAWLPTFEE